MDMTTIIMSMSMSMTTIMIMIMGMRNPWNERSRLPPRREEVIVLLSGGFDRGPRSTESGIIDGTLESEPQSSNPRLRDPSRGSIEPSTSIERGRVPSSMLLRKAFTGVSYDHEPTLIERGMDVRSNHPLPAQPGIHRSILSREARVASSSVPSNGEHEVRRKLEISPTTPNKARFEDLRRSLGGYTSGCASVPPRIPRTREGTEVSKASTSTSLRMIEPHSRGGSGATQRPTIATTPRHPSRSRWTTTLEQGSTSRETFTLERVISVSLRSRLELATLGMTPKALRPINPNHDDAPLQSKSRGSLLHATTHAPEKTLVKSTRNNLTWQQHCANHSFDFARLGRATILEGDPRRRLQRLDLDAVRNRHKKEGHHVSHCHVVSWSWKARFPLAQHMYSHPPSLVYKRGREAHANGWGARRTQELISFSRLACNPLLRATRNWCSAPLLDVRPRGRNQDKTPRLFTRHRGNESISTADHLFVPPHLSKSEDTPLAHPTSFLLHSLSLFFLPLVGRRPQGSSTPPPLHLAGASPEGRRSSTPASYTTTTSSSSPSKKLPQAPPSFSLLPSSSSRSRTIKPHSSSPYTNLRPLLELCTSLKQTAPKTEVGAAAAELFFPGRRAARKIRF
nr:unnamed protein product [Digitaria exilis]